MKVIRAILAAAALLSTMLMAAPASAATCSSTGQNISTRHNSVSTTVTIITRRCGRSYRGWLRDNQGHIHLGAWRTTGQSNVLTSYGNFAGGWQWQYTGDNKVDGVHQAY